MKLMGLDIPDWVNPVASFDSSQIQQGTGMTPDQQYATGAAVGVGSSFGAATSYLQANPWLGMAGIGYLGAQQTNQTNRDIAQRQMDFQAGQTGTAYQRATQDMLAAGLNPALAYQQGGAASGNGAGIPAVNALGAALDAGISGFNAISENDLRDAQSANLNQQTKNLMDSSSGIKFDNITKSYEAKKSKLKGEIFDHFKQQLMNLQNRGAGDKSGAFFKGYTPPRDFNALDQLGGFP